jgi:hypothetical protein
MVHWKGADCEVFVVVIVVVVVVIVMLMTVCFSQRVAS